mgnify:CR=1 FL=1
MEDGSDVEDEGRGVDVAGVGRRGTDPRRRSDAASDGDQSAAIAQLENGRDRRA